MRWFFLNPDALIESGSARALANCGKTLTAPWVTGGMLRDVHGREQRGGRRGALTPLSALISFTPLHKFSFLSSIHKEDEPLPTKPAAYPICGLAFNGGRDYGPRMVSGYSEGCDWALEVSDGHSTARIIAISTSSPLE